MGGGVRASSFRILATRPGGWRPISVETPPVGGPPTWSTGGRRRRRDVAGDGKMHSTVITRNQNMRIKLSKTDWKSIGQKMGWLKTAQSTYGDEYWSERDGPRNEPGKPRNEPGKDGEDAGSAGGKPNKMDAAKPAEGRKQWPEWESPIFSYLTELEPGDEVLKRLRHKAEHLLGMGNTPEDLHKALYWTFHQDNDLNRLHRKTKELIPYYPLPWQNEAARAGDNVQLLTEALTRVLKFRY